MLFWLLSNLNRRNLASNGSAFSRRIQSPGENVLLEFCKVCSQGGGKLSLTWVMNGATMFGCRFAAVASSLSVKNLWSSSLNRSLIRKWLDLTSSRVWRLLVWELTILLGVAGRARIWSKVR